MSTLTQIEAIFRDVFDDESLNITRATSASDIDAWDSLAHINLILTVEKEFGVKFALGELQDLRNVGDMIDVIDEKIAQNRK